uniref:Uncharacterized protein n=1 Tax=Arundo donax TaxID=35708 RepID=A0A0A9CYP3_ARUDO
MTMQIPLLLSRSYSLTWLSSSTKKHSVVICSSSKTKF